MTRACAVVQPNVCYCGGVTHVRRIAALAEASLISIAPHNPNGPIGTMVSIHVALTLPNFVILKLVRDDVPWRADIVDGHLDVHNGYVLPPTRPGIGLELVEKVAAAHPVNRPYRTWRPGLTAHCWTGDVTASFGAYGSRW